MHKENVRLCKKNQLSGESSKRQIDRPKLWADLPYYLAAFVYLAASVVTASVISLSLAFNSEFIDFVVGTLKKSKQSSSSEVEIAVSGEILEQDIDYFCEDNSGSPIAFARSDIGNIPMVEFNGEFNDMDELQRCEDFSRRLKKFHLQKNIDYITWMKTDEEGGRAIAISKYEGNIRSEENSEFLLAVHPDDQIYEIQEGLRGILSSYEEKGAIKN